MLHDEGKFAAFRELEFDQSLPIGVATADMLSTLLAANEKLSIRGSMLVDTLSALKRNGTMPIMQSAGSGKETEGFA